MRVNKYARPRLSTRIKTLFLRRFLGVFIVCAILFIATSAWVGQPKEQAPAKAQTTLTHVSFNSTPTDNFSQTTPQTVRQTVPQTALQTAPQTVSLTAAKTVPQTTPQTAPQIPILPVGLQQSTVHKVAQTPPKLDSSTTLSPELASKVAPLDAKTAYPTGPLEDTVIFDSLKLKKSEHRLYAMCKGTVKRVYSVALGEYPQGHRKIQGDKKTPEGRYSIIAKENLTEYYKSLRLSYPNASDLLTAQELGKPVGTHVFIHGLPPDLAFLDSAHRVSDWTNGSIAVTNTEIDELYKHLRLGAPITIEP